MSRFCSADDYKNVKAVKTAYPSATKIVKVHGGWQVFDTWTDYQIWKNQK